MPKGTGSHRSLWVEPRNWYFDQRSMCKKGLCLCSSGSFQGTPSLLPSVGSLQIRDLSFRLKVFVLSGPVQHFPVLSTITGGWVYGRRSYVLASGSPVSSAFDGMTMTICFRFRPLVLLRNLCSRARLPQRQCARSREQGRTQEDWSEGIFSRQRWDSHGLSP